MGAATQVVYSLLIFFVIHIKFSRLLGLYVNAE